MTSPSTDRRLGLLGSTALKTPVTVVATSNITQHGEQTIDGVAVHAVNAAGVPDRVLCTAQTNTTQNGIWDVSLTDWTRSLDADGNYDLKNGTVVMVGSGTANAQTAWALAATDPVAPGSSVMAWAKALWSTIAAALFIQSGTGAVARGVQDKMRDVASFEDYGAVGDGVADDLTPLTNAIASGKRIIAQRGKTYKFSNTLTITDQQVDFSGATLLYTGATSQFALVINAVALWSSTDVRNFYLKCTSVDTVNRTHGVCFGGSVRVKNFRVEGFTGISVALGHGVESYTGVTLPGLGSCFYAEIERVQIAPTAGWGFVVATSNNANRISNLSVFPFNGLGDSIPHAANCINQIVVRGISNVFERVSVEASASGDSILFFQFATDNEFVGRTYFEYNPSWAVPPVPRVTAQAQSVGNKLLLRHIYTAVGNPFSDLGTANRFATVPGNYANGAQVDAPSASTNLLKNGRFLNGTHYWSDFSAGTVLSTGTGFLSGNSLRMDVTAGKPNVIQDVVATSGFAAAALQNQNVTYSCYAKTNLVGAHMSVAGITQGDITPDGNWYYMTGTAKVPSAATTCSAQFITTGSGLTGYLEVSNITVVFGCDPLVMGPLQPLDGSAAYNPPSIAAGAQTTTTVTVTGAALGDYAVASFSLDLQGISLDAYVSAADTVTCVFRNGTVGAVDLASGTLRSFVTKQGITA